MCLVRIGVRSCTSGSPHTPHKRKLFGSCCCCCKLLTLLLLFTTLLFCFVILVLRLFTPLCSVLPIDFVALRLHTTPESSPPQSLLVSPLHLGFFVPSSRWIYSSSITVPSSRWLCSSSLTMSSSRQQSNRSGIGSTLA